MEIKRRRLDSPVGAGDGDPEGDTDGEGVEASVEAVLPDDLLGNVPLVDCHVGIIGDPKHTSRLIRALNDVKPIPSLQHLKRVRRRPGDGPGGGAGRFEVLLAPATEHPSGAECLAALSLAGLDTRGLSAEVEVAAVPAAPPRTRRQFTSANALWACHFHEDAALERLLAGDIFTTAELQRHRHWMRRALQAARRGTEDGVEAGAVVVDPARDALVAEASDCRLAHPLRHAAMNVVDLVAWSQRGGAWPLHRGDLFDGDLPDKPPPVGTVRNREGESDKPAGPYLCTGYDVYLSREPCTMCAMALVHSRARRVLYAAPTPHGVLGSRAKLHAVRALNHHYQVFKGPAVSD